MKRSNWSGWARTNHNDVTRMDAPSVTQSAIEKSLAHAEPVANVPGKYVVFLEPPVVVQGNMKQSEVTLGAR